VAVSSVVALGGVSLTVEPGEAFGFIGANGAGKTTAIKILMGLIRPTKRNGARFRHRRGPAGSARLGLGYVPKTPISTII
jgi:ABC-type multidrug transport system ATPase subunit